MLTELKPCPFCGGTLAVDGSAPGHAENCYVVLRLANRGIDDEFHAAWNRRVASAAPAEGREAFEAAYRKLFLNNWQVFPGLWEFKESSGYFDDEVNKAWKLWKFALATAPTMSEAAQLDKHTAQTLLHEAACECMSPEQADKYEALFVGADDLPLRFLHCILKRIDRAAAKEQS